MQKEGVPAPKTEDGAPEQLRKEGAPMEIKVDDIPVQFQLGEVPKPEGVPVQTSDMWKSKLADSAKDRELEQSARCIYVPKKNGGYFLIN